MDGTRLHLRRGEPGGSLKTARRLDLCREHLQGLMGQITKGVLFNPSRPVPPTAAAMDTSG